MVLFTSLKTIERAENIRAVYDAYKGEKRFLKRDVWHDPIPPADVVVTDEFVANHAGTTVMVFHAIAGGKTYGLDMPHPYVGRQHTSLIDYALSSSEEMISLVAKQCGIPAERVLPYGVPRTDALIGKKKSLKKRMYLYAPTFRPTPEQPYQSPDWEYINSCLTDDELLIVKPHMAQPQMGVEYSHITEVSGQEPTASYLIECDVVITDYSSVVFDGWLMEKPAILFENDAEKMLKVRGMYLKYPDDYSGRHCRTEKELVELMKSADGLTDNEKRCRDRIAGACDGHSTERTVELIRSLL